MFTFNKDYHDKEQVRHLLPQFIALREALVAAGQFPYNDSFLGKIDGAEGPHESTAIYLLQNLYRIEQEQREMDALRDRMQPLRELATTRKFARVVLYFAGYYVGGTGLRASYDNARIVPQDGKPYIVLPKGARVKGYLAKGAEVLVEA